MAIERKTEARWNESARRWEISVQAEGQRKKCVGKSGDRSRKAKLCVERKADEWLVNRLQGENTRVGVMLDKYIQYAELNTSAGNAAQIKSYSEAWIRPEIGNKRCGQLAEQNLQDIINRAARPLTDAESERERAKHGEAKRGGRVKTGELSEKSLKNLRGVLVQFVKFLRRNKASTLALEGLTIPRGARESDRKALQPGEIVTLYTSDRTEYYGKPCSDWFVYLYRFAAATGMRPGEIIGLRCEDVEGSYVSIRRSVDFRGNITPGKNKNAQRRIELTELARQAVEGQRAMLAAAGVTSVWLFPDRDGDCARQINILDALARYCAVNGIRHVTPYELRHTYVSVNKKMPPQLLQLQVGHAESMDTGGTYGHELEGDMHAAAGYANIAFAEILRSVNNGVNSMLQ